MHHGKMCEFWIEEFKKGDSEQSRKYRDVDCARNNTSFN